MYELCIKLVLIKELYYDARPNKSQDLLLVARTGADLRYVEVCYQFRAWW